MSLENPLLSTPRFPSYPGPYKVGTAEYEIPISDLSSPSIAPAPDPAISTISFRVFYPTGEQEKPSKPVYWVPDPQREFVGAYARFLGANWAFSKIASYLPTFLQWIKIPVLLNAPVKVAANPSKRWPLMVFSHGIGGSKNTYSYLLGSLASHGMIVIAPEHRDGSGPVSIIRQPEGTRTRVAYEHIEHQMGPEVLEKRHRQMRIRVWELGLVHDALLKLDCGGKLTNLVPKSGVDPEPGPSFRSSLDIHNPGSISWAGHSFGAATMVQFVKSIFWRLSNDSAPHISEPCFSEYGPLYTPQADSSLVSQITPKSPMILLDLWNLPLRGDNIRWLWEKPLPCYTANDKVGPSNVLAIMSEAFFKWEANLKATKFVLSDRPTSSDGQRNGVGPRLFYPLRSAHLSQSDVGILFPRIMKRWLRAEEPERTMELNVTAVLQMLRESGTILDGLPVEGEETTQENQDWGRILATDGSIRGWVSVPVEHGGTPPGNPKQPKL